MMRSTVLLRSVHPQTWALYRRLVLLLVALVTLLVGALVAPPAAYSEPIDNRYALEPVDEGDAQHIPILIYRHRHTFLTQSSADPDSFVSWARNVAEFEWVEQQGQTEIRWVVVASNVSRFRQNSQVTLIDLFQRDPTGQLRLVDPAGNSLLEADGKTPVDWRTSSTPSFQWDLRTEPELKSDLDSGRMHSERVAYWFLKNHMSSANDTVQSGLSEKVPCDASPSWCVWNLKSSWFKQIKTMKFTTDLESQAKLKTKGTPRTKEQLKKGEDSDTFVQKVFEKWQRLGMPSGSDAAALMGGRLFHTPGNPAPRGAGATALSQGVDPGGIDFSTLELRYLSEDKDGQLHYALSATPATGNGHKVTEGQIAAAQMSDAFFVWLSLPESKFWVNLNPSEPDRIVDAKLGKTDVGRILLQADFQMKKLVGHLIHPDTNLGMQFWGSLYNSSHSCINMRQWIVPAPATVYEQNGGLYIVDTPLQVKMETDYLKQQGETSSCITPDTRMESTFHTLVLPKVEDAVNHAPEFAELRRVYLSRVAAEWYRQRHSHGGVLSSMIDSDKVSAWPALQQWSPHQVFHQYVDSYQKKEFNVTKRVTQGDTIYENTYTYGGVDFSNVVLRQAPQSLFQHDHADLPGVVQQSFQQLATDQHGKVWLGSTAPSAISSSPQGSGRHFTMYLLLLAVIGVAVAVWARSWWWLRLAHAPNPPVRPQATQSPAKPQPTQTRSSDPSNLELRSLAVQAEYRKYHKRKLARESQTLSSRKPPAPNQRQHRRDDQ